MDDHQAVGVTIAGKQYDIKCPQEKAASLKEAVRHFDTLLCEIRDADKLLGRERSAIMTGIQMSYELLQCQKELEHMRNQIKQTQKKMEEVLTLQGQFAL